MAAAAEHVIEPRARGPVRFIDTREEGWRPVVFFGGLGTDVNAFYETEFARPLREQLRLRVVSVERNGFGMTPFDPSRRLGDAVDDVVSVVDDLGVRRFAVVAISGGAPFAAALAARVPQRVLSLHLVAAGAGPLLASCGTASVLYASPRRLAMDPALAHEWHLVTSDPLPDLSGLYAPAYLYWGYDDDVVPVEHVREWRRVLPRVAALRGYRGEGHDVHYRHWEQILRDLAGVGAVTNGGRRAGAG
ncbi:MAG: alpha/beta hydrolase [Solirubrobacterales bacterium]|nr:alpha/beta hydrolase [Solirubrobacterales bacterium]